MPTTLSPFTRRPPAAPTVAQLIRFGAREFDAAGLAYGHGTADARDDAAALVFHALGLDHAAAEAAYATWPARPQVEQVLGLFAERLRRRVPVAYLMGRMWFAGHEFEVDERVIVPRSPFAELIARGFAPWIEAGRVRRVVDLGTGSGCIAIACALRPTRRRSSKRPRRRTAAAPATGDGGASRAVMPPIGAPPAARRCVEQAGLRAPIRRRVRRRVRRPRRAR